MLNYKTGRGVLNKMRRILETPYPQRRQKFGRGWAWDLTNGQERIREEFPELVPEMKAIFTNAGPKTCDDLYIVAP